MNETNQRLPVVIQVSREAVESGDISRVVAILNSFVPGLCERNRNQVEIEVMGYLDDSRELYEIPEARAYFQKLFAHYPGLFFWINMETHMFNLLAVLLYPLIRVPKGITISPQNMAHFMFKGFTGLNEFCAKHGQDPKPTTAAALALAYRMSLNRPDSPNVHG